MGGQGGLQGWACARDNFPFQDFPLAPAFGFPLLPCSFLSSLPNFLPLPPQPCPSFLIPPPPSLLPQLSSSHLPSPPASIFLAWFPALRRWSHPAGSSLQWGCQSPPPPASQACSPCAEGYPLQVSSREERLLQELLTLPENSHLSSSGPAWEGWGGAQLGKETMTWFQLFFSLEVSPLLGR